MMISTKGRYALRVMIDLAQNSKDGFVSLKDVAERQQISMKYLEMIVSILNRGKMVKSQRGKAGGYRLIKEPSEYSVGSIIKLAEGTLAPVSCLEEVCNISIVETVRWGNRWLPWKYYFEGLNGRKGKKIKTE